jgi:hypothetical protein
MRIWSLHPKYLDTKGLVALWRETLLAQNVLLGKTSGYKNHPQLNRFKNHNKPVDAISAYLLAVHEESLHRDYNFNKTKIVSLNQHVEKIYVASGQLEYEFAHLKAKLLVRDLERYEEILEITSPEAHPLFYIVDGHIADWEVRD